MLDELRERLKKVETELLNDDGIYASHNYEISRDMWEIGKALDLIEFYLGDISEVKANFRR